MDQELDYLKYDYRKKENQTLMADLKRVYAAPTEEIALMELDRFDKNGAENTLRLQNHGKIIGKIFPMTRTMQMVKAIILKN